MTDAPPDEVFALLTRLFGAEGHLWSIGTFAGFMGCDLTGIPAEDNGALVLESKQTRARLRPGARLLAFETLSSEPRGWNHGIALCLPGGGRLVPRDRRLSVLPGDDRAIRAEDRNRPLVDLGLGHEGLRCAFRPAPDALGQAMLLSGQHWSDGREALTALPGDWITETPILRVERAGDGSCPIHAIPQAGARGLTHAATTPVPKGLLPLAHIFPPHPLRVKPGLRRPFDPAIHAAFQTILSRHGRPDLRALKAEILALLTTAAPPPDASPTDRHALAVIRVTLRQWLASHEEVQGDWFAAWLRRYDRPLLTAFRAGA